jgi:hypothetical protein
LLLSGSPPGLEATQAFIGAVHPAANHGPGRFGLSLLPGPTGPLRRKPGPKLLELSGREDLSHVTEHGLSAFAEGAHLLHEPLERRLPPLHAAPHGVAFSGLPSLAADAFES